MEKQADRTKPVSSGISTLTIAILLAALFVSGCNQNGDQLVLSGTLETDDHDLIAPFTAELLEIRVREGDRVARGDTVAILDTVSVAAAYQAAGAALDEAAARLADLEAGSDIEKIRAAKAELEIARANLAQSKRDLTRFDSLATAHLIDQQRLEQVQLANERARSSLKVAEEKLADLRRGARVHQIEAAQAAWERARAEETVRRRDYEKAFLLADHDGVVQWLPYQVGEYVPAGRAAATIHDPSSLWARVYVPEAQMNQVAPGDTVTFAVDAYANRRFHGTVVFLSASAEFTPRNVQTPDERLNLVFAVKIAIAPGQDGLRAGMPADFFFE